MSTTIAADDPVNVDIVMAGNAIIDWVVAVDGVCRTDPIGLCIFGSVDEPWIELKTSTVHKSVCLVRLSGIIKQHEDAILYAVRNKLKAHGFMFRVNATKPAVALARPPVAPAVLITPAESCQPSTHGNAVPHPTTPAAFFQVIGLTPEQTQRVRAELPDADLFLLSCFDHDTLVACGLKAPQIHAWERIAKALYP